MSGRSEIESLLVRHGLSCAAARLSVLSVDAKRTVCDRWPGPIGQDQRLDVLEAIEERALRQANMIGGVHTFMLELLDNEGSAIVSELFRVSAEAMPGISASVATEPPNEAGLVAQMMRHNEANFRLSIMAWQTGMAAQERAVERASLRADRAEDKYAQNLEFTQNALLSERQHELELIRAQTKAKATGALVDQVVALLPEAASAIVNHTVKQPAAAAAIGMKGLLGSVRPEQMAKILEALDPEQQITLINAMKRLAEAEAPPAPPATEKVNGKAPH